jgi:virginiamycin B lyase
MRKGSRIMQCSTREQQHLQRKLISVVFSTLLLLSPILSNLLQIPVVRAVSPYYITMSDNYFGAQILSAEEDNFTNPAHATFSLLNGTQLWYSIIQDPSSPDVPMTAADPRGDLVTATFFTYHLLPPTGAFPLDWNGSYQFETLNLAASFSAAGQSIQFELSPFTYQAALMDALHLLTQIIGSKDQNDAAGLLIPGSIQSIFDAASSMTDLVHLVNDLSKVINAYPHVDTMTEYAYDCAKDLGSLLGNGEEVNRLANILWLMQGKVIPLSEVITSLESMGGYWGRIIQLGLSIFGFVRDELLAMGSVLFEQHNPTVSLQSNAVATPTPTPTQPPAGTKIFYPLPSDAGSIGEIIVGSDGTPWFTTSMINTIAMSDQFFVGHITSQGNLSLYATLSSTVPAYNTNGQGQIALGPDGAIWAIEQGMPSTDYQASIDRIASDGTITKYPLPSSFSVPYTIVAGPDGALWFTYGELAPQNSPGMIGRITTNGVISTYSLPNGELPSGITVGPDKAIWFSYNGPQDTVSGIGRMNLSGQVTATYPVTGGEGGIYYITKGPDGAFWVNAYPSIERVTMQGVVTQLPNLLYGGAYQFAFGPDGTLWYVIYGMGSGSSTGPNLCHLVHLSTSGQQIQQPVTFACLSGAFAFDHQGNLWIDTWQNNVEGISHWFL